MRNKYSRRAHVLERDFRAMLRCIAHDLPALTAELNLNMQSLQKWKQKFKALPAGQVTGMLEALQAENQWLQGELQRLVQQRASSRA
jgi:tRNA nucleotidyltransferase/poly(A) polymerase